MQAIGSGLRQLRAGLGLPSPPVNDSQSEQFKGPNSVVNDDDYDIEVHNKTSGGGGVGGDGGRLDASGDSAEGVRSSQTPSIPLPPPPSPPPIPLKSQEMKNAEWEKPFAAAIAQGGFQGLSKVGLSNDARVPPPNAGVLIANTFRSANPLRRASGVMGVSQPFGPLQARRNKTNSGGRLREV